MTASQQTETQEASSNGVQRYLDALDGFVLDELTPLIGFKFGALALYGNGLEWIGDITAVDEGRLLSVPGIGVRKLELINAYLAERGLRLNAPCRTWLDYRARNAREVKGPVEYHSTEWREALSRLQAVSKFGL